MRPQEIIAKKRDGKRLSRREIESFIKGVTDGSWADYQITALVMAMYLNELDFREQSYITHAMLHSGDILDFSGVPSSKADKHSTGGVGDKTSLMIAPLAAACGLAVPMISGRGLDHTGGTLDKLESIPGYDVKLTGAEFHSLIRECGFAMSGQTEEIAPADRKIYALRDATATVPTIPLIVASIMSKKLAEGLDALVLDVKTGNGAFMKRTDDARRLASEMVKTGIAFGVNTRALITDMNQPLGRYVGNALEVYECIRLLRGEGDDKMAPTQTLSVALTSHMLVLADEADSFEEGRKMVLEALESGRGFERFVKNVEMQHGDTAVCENPDRLLDPEMIEIEVRAETSGCLTGIDTERIGRVISELGGGRTRADDGIDHAVGYSCVASLGDGISEGDLLGIVITRQRSGSERLVRRLRKSYKIEEKTVEMPELIVEVVR